MKITDIRSSQEVAVFIPSTNNPEKVHNSWKIEESFATKTVIRLVKMTPLIRPNN